MSAESFPPFPAFTLPFPENQEYLQEFPKFLISHGTFDEIQSLKIKQILG